jgi:cardiolipin synthase
MTTWRSEKLFFDGDPFFADLLSGIENAKRSICLETYIFQPDEMGRRFEVALSAAAARGVEVRVLVDGIGASTWVETKHEALIQAGVDIRVYHPVLVSNLISRALTDLGIKGSKKAKGSSLLSRLNRRTHRKLCIIDDEIAWVGSCNISSDHSRAIKGDLAWRDTAARVEGEGASDLKKAFEVVWIRAHDAKGKRRWHETFFPGPPKILRPSGLVRLNHTMSLRRKAVGDFLKRMNSAQKRLWITNAYFAPSLEIVRALERAVDNGADVRIMVPQISDVFFMPWVARSYYSPLLKRGVKIYEYVPRFLHAKSVIIDDWAMVGTTNFNRRSFVHDFEVDVVLSHPESVEELAAQYEIDLAQSERIEKAAGGIKAFLGRWVSRTFKNWI